MLPLLFPFAGLRLCVCTFCTNGDNNNKSGSDRFHRLVQDLHLAFSRERIWGSQGGGSKLLPHQLEGLEEHCHDVHKHANIKLLKCLCRYSWTTDVKQAQIQTEQMCCVYFVEFLQHGMKPARTTNGISCITLSSCMIIQQTNNAYLLHFRTGKFVTFLTSKNK